MKDEKNIIKEPIIDLFNYFYFLTHKDFPCHYDIFSQLLIAFLKKKLIFLIITISPLGNVSVHYNALFQPAFFLHIFRINVLNNICSFLRSFWTHCIKSIRSITKSIIAMKII